MRRARLWGRPDPSSGAPSAAGGARVPASRRRAGRVVAGVVGVGLGVAVTSGAVAEPSPSVAQVRKNVQELRHQAEVATERYNTTKEQLGSVGVRIRAANQQQQRQAREVQAARQQLGRIAAETYRRGKVSTLDYVLSDDPDAALAQAGLLPTLGDRQAASIARLTEAERRLAALRAELAEQQGRAAQAQRDLRAQRSAVLQRLAQAEAQLDSLTAAERAEVEEDTSTPVADSGETGSAGRVTCGSAAVNAPTAKARKAISYACDQLGEPYSWAGDGPGSWDCSGLTMKAWASAGVSLPHSSQMQAGYGTRVSTGSLRPGDLVFFHSPISHVGIYLGNGRMVHAPQSGDVVKVADMYRTPSAAARLG